MTDFNFNSLPNNQMSNLERMCTLQLAALEMIVFKLDRIADLLNQSIKLQEKALNLDKTISPSVRPSKSINSPMRRQ
jgi:hypothetical protein